MKVHPSQIYDIISKRISHIISNIEQNTEDHLKTVASDSLENLRKINEKIQNEYHDLKKSSEWNRFTIAFYGETNAGKSTLIEALRLLWREESKLKEQEQFRAIQQKSGLTQEAFDNIQNSYWTAKKISENPRTHWQTLNGNMHMKRPERKQKSNA